MGAIRFVQVWTLKRGVIDPPEPLDDANQWRAFSSWREEMSRQVRVDFEVAGDDARVVWDGRNGWRYARPARTRQLPGISRTAREMGAA